MADPVRTTRELLEVPFPLLLSQAAEAVAEAQVALDESSMRLQAQLDELTAAAIADSGDEASGLARYQVDATWYHIPEVEIDVRMALTMKIEEETRSDGRRVLRPRLRSVPYNVTSSRQSTLEATGTSSVKAKIVSVPAAQRSQ